MKINVDVELDEILWKLKSLQGYNIETAITEIKKVFNYSDAKPLKERRNEFKEELRPYISAYGEAMIVNFFEYWSESSLKGRLMRKEKQPTWETKRRLDTWAENQKKFSIAGIIAKRQNS